MTEPHPADLPSAFVDAWVEQVPPTLSVPRRALDLAMGRGRHTQLLAARGWRTFGIDWNLEALREARANLARAHLNARVWCADLTSVSLPSAAFDLIVVTRYLDRRLFPRLLASLTPGGRLVYETFTVHQRRHHRGPTSPAHLLEEGELRQHLMGAELEFYEEVDEPDALARAVARTSSRS